MNRLRVAAIVATLCLYPLTVLTPALCDPRPGDPRPGDPGRGEHRPSSKQAATAKQELFSKGQFRIFFRSRADKSQIVVSNFGKGEVEVFAVEDPARIVVDIAGAPQKFTKSIAISENSFVRGIRFGQHPDKLRMVVDLQDEAGAGFDWKRKGEVGILAISAASAAPPPAADPNAENFAHALFGAGQETPEPATAPVAATATSAPPIKPTKAPTVARAKVITIDRPAVLEPTPEPTPAAPVTEPTEPPAREPTSPPPAATPTAEPETASPPVATPVDDYPSAETTTEAPAEPTVAFSGPLLRALRFELFGKSKERVIRVLMTQRVAFSLVRQDDTAYDLTISGASVAARHLEYEQFPPQDWVGFTFVKPTVFDNTLNIRIGVERGKRLSAVALDEGIVVRVIDADATPNPTPQAD